jgi:signal transduction histidine kinase
LPVSASGDELSDLGISFNTLLDRLQSSYEAQRRFTSNAAHELRTPLTVLLGQIEVALRKPRTSDEYRRTLELLHQEAKDLQQTLESLLYLARSVEDDSPPDAIPTQLAEWLSQYVGRWSSHPRYRDLHLQASDTADVVVSQPLLSRLIDNLVGNALKYSPHGTPVVLKLSRNGEVADLSVIDEGPGIPADEVSSIFDPFVRARSARSSGVEGTGLGLSIAARIAEAIHGTLRCKSQPGQGATFTLSLPCIP